jgi:hypothetical protein
MKTCAITDCRTLIEKCWKFCTYHEAALNTPKRRLDVRERGPGSSEKQPLRPMKNPKQQSAS